MVDDIVAYPTHKHNKGLAMKIGRVTELRPDKNAVQVQVVHSTALPGNLLHQQVSAEICVIIDRNHNGPTSSVKKGDLIRITPEIGDEGIREICHVESHIITMRDV